MVCLCAPTSHEGSFRCRLHRAGPSFPTANPAQSSANHNQGKGANLICSSSAVRADQAGSTPAPATLRGSSASVSTRPAALHRPSNDLVALFAQFSHADPLASDHSRHNWFRSRSSAISASHTVSSPSSTSRWLSSTSSSYRSSPAASRAAASSSSPSPSSPLSYTRPPQVKRSPSSSPPAPSKSLSPPLRSGTTSGSTTTPSASHAAAMAIMNQHSQNKQGVRNHNHSMLYPASRSKIGLSRLSRMAVACADHGVQPLCRDGQRSDSNHPPHVAQGTATTCSADITIQTGSTVLEAVPMRPNTRSTMTNFKQIETSCRVVGTKGESVIMPAVF